MSQSETTDNDNRARDCAKLLALCREMLARLGETPDGPWGRALGPFATAAADIAGQLGFEGGPVEFHEYSISAPEFPAAIANTYPDAVLVFTVQLRNPEGGRHTFVVYVQGCHEDSLREWVGQGDGALRFVYGRVEPLPPPFGVRYVKTYVDEDARASAKQTLLRWIRWLEAFHVPADVPRADKGQPERAAGAAPEGGTDGAAAAEQPRLVLRGLDVPATVDGAPLSRSFTMAEWNVIGALCDARDKGKDGLTGPQLKLSGARSVIARLLKGDLGQQLRPVLHTPKTRGGKYRVL